jgi:hypothetical protein
MYKNVVFRIIAGLVLLAAIAGIAFFAYQVGATHGAVANVQLPTAGNGQPFQPYFWHPFFGVDIFSLLFGFFLLMLAFSAMRRLIFGPRWGWRHMDHGRMGQGPWSEGVPPMFAEWHRRAHAAPESDKAPDGNQK